MEKVRAVIVDDSSFAIAFIREILEGNGFEVVGTAASLKEVTDVVKDKKPDLVTMDITLPGADGLSCTRAIHEIDENIKVIVISSMMDSELVERAKQSKICAYVQKPVDPDELVSIINSVMASDGLYQFLENEHLLIFKDSLKNSLDKMTKLPLAYVDEYSFNEEFVSMGLTFLIGIIGKFSGRMLLDLSREVAEELTASILKRKPKNDDEVAAVLGEFANIVSGSACSLLNIKNKDLGLRISPPSTLYGGKVVISPPDFVTTTVIAETSFGKILLNVGFKRGEKRWM